MTFLCCISVKERSQISGPGLGPGSEDLDCGLALLPSDPGGLPLPRAPSLP